MNKLEKLLRSWKESGFSAETIRKSLVAMKAIYGLEVADIEKLLVRYGFND